jgi:hypothetical protein
MTLTDHAAQLQADIRALEAEIQARAQALMDTALRERFEVGFRAGQQSKEIAP